VTALDATLYRLECLRDAATHEAQAHTLRGNPDAADQSADEAAAYDRQIIALCIAAL
jgi:hypothetical protein